MTVNWTLKTTGTTPNGLYDYVAPTSIKIEVFAEGTTWWELTTLAGTARSYTLSNYPPWVYTQGGSRRVALRVTCIRSGNTNTSSVISYWFTGSTGTAGTWYPVY